MGKFSGSAPFLFGGTMLFLSALPWNFYPIGKLLAFIIAAYGCYTIHDRHKINLPVSFWVCLGISVIFNPIVPLRLNDRNLWSIVDVIGAVAFAWVGFQNHISNNSLSNKNSSLVVKQSFSAGVSSTKTVSAGGVCPSCKSSYKAPMSVCPKCWDKLI